MIIQAKNYSAIVQTLSILIIGAIVISMIPYSVIHVDESETALNPAVPAIPIFGNDDATSFLRNIEQKSAEARSASVWERLNSPLRAYVATGVPGPEMVVIKGQPRILLFAEPDFDPTLLNGKLYMTRMANLGFISVVEGFISHPDQVLEIANSEGVLSVDADVWLREEVPDLSVTASDLLWEDELLSKSTAEPLGRFPQVAFEDQQLLPMRFQIRELTGAAHAEATWGLNGTGVRVGLADTGVDFGNPNLAPALDLNNGYPTLYDDGGEGLLYAPIVASENATGYLETNSTWDDHPVQISRAGAVTQNFNISQYAGIGMPYNTPQDWSWVKVPQGVSISGVWKVGITNLGPSSGSGRRFYHTLFCDPNTAEVYDRLYIDWESSFAASNLAYGEGGGFGDTPFEWGRSQLNWDITDEHADGNYWDMIETPQAALGADGLPGGGDDRPEVWSMAHDYCNGSFLGFDPVGNHVNVTVRYQHMQLPLDSYGNFKLEYDYQGSSYNVSMDDDWDAGYGILANATYALNGLFSPGDSFLYSIYGYNASGWFLLETGTFDVLAVPSGFAPDGYPDISLGVLCHANDMYDMIPNVNHVAFMTMDPVDTYATVFYDHDGHGTSVALDIAGRDIIKWDVYQNGTLYSLEGQAPDAFLLPVRVMTSGSVFWSWMWQCAIDVVDVPPVGEVLGWNGSWYHYYDNHAIENPPLPVDLITNSWGYSEGIHSWTNFIIEGLSIPGMVSDDRYFVGGSGDPYPGVLFLFSAGNEGPGYMNAGPPHADVVLSVGAITSSHIWDDVYGPNQPSDDFASFTSRGPGRYGQVVPDIVTYGCWETSVDIINNHWNGYAAVGTFGGTSMASPVAAGSIACLIERINEISWGNGVYKTFTPQDLKILAKSTAWNMDADPYTQGAGALNITAAIEYLDDWEVSNPSTQFLMWTNASNINMAPFLASRVHDEWANRGIDVSYSTSFKSTDPIEVIDSEFFAGRCFPGESSTAAIFAQSTSSDLANAPTAYHHVRNPSLTRMAAFSNNFVWNSAGFVTTFDDRPAWNLTELLWSSKTGLTSWALGDEGLVCLQIAIDGAYFGGDYPYFFLHDWTDDGDAILEYRDISLGIPGEAHRITGAFSSANTWTMWVRPQTLANLADSLTLVEGTGWSQMPLNYTIWAEYYALEDWSWVQIAPSANGDGSRDVTLNIPSNAEPGYYEGFLNYTNDGGSLSQIFPLSVAVTLNATHRQGGTSSPVVTNEYTPGLIYDNAEYRQGDLQYSGYDNRLFTVYVPQWDAKSLVVMMNWSNPGVEMDVTAYEDAGAVYDVLLNGSSLYLTANALAVVFAISGDGWYSIITRCSKINGTTPVEAVDMKINWGYDLPEFQPTAFGYAAFPSDNAIVGRTVQEFSSSLLNVTWINSSSDFPDAAIVNSMIDISTPDQHLVHNYEFNAGTGYDDQYFDLGFLEAGAQIDIVCDWTISADTDMMDVGFYNGTVGSHDPGIGDDELTNWAMATAGGSPEMWSGTIAVADNYYIRLINYAQEDTKGTVTVDTFTSGENVVSSTANAIFDTLIIADGLWELVVEAQDNFGMTHRRSILVSLENFEYVKPAINQPDNIDFEAGSTGHNITWHVSDAHPANYTLYQNATVFNSLSEVDWVSGELSFSVDSLSAGIHNFTLVVWDEYSNWANSTAWVTVHPSIPPAIDHPANITYAESTTGHNITWNPSDAYPSSYRIYVNGTMDSSGTWTGASITIDVDGLNVGVHNYTIVVYDVSGNWAGDTVWVIVTRAPDTIAPSVDHPLDISYEEGTTGNAITWRPNDLHPDSYTIYRDGSAIASDDWDGSAISINVDFLAVGTYNYTIAVFDASGNWVSDTVWVRVTPAKSLTSEPESDTDEERSVRSPGFTILLVIGFIGVALLKKRQY
ncbi:MAG: S8 family serine peptidase [Candidatus Thorarchaeota archaeon]